MFCYDWCLLVSRLMTLTWYDWWSITDGCYLMMTDDCMTVYWYELWLSSDRWWLMVVIVNWYNWWSSIVRWRLMTDSCYGWWVFVDVFTMWCHLIWPVFVKLYVWLDRWQLMFVNCYGWWVSADVTNVCQVFKLVICYLCYVKRSVEPFIACFDII